MKRKDATNEDDTPLTGDSSLADAVGAINRYRETKGRTNFPELDDEHGEKPLCRWITMPESTQLFYVDDNVPTLHEVRDLCILIGVKKGGAGDGARGGPSDDHAQAVAVVERVKELKSETGHGTASACQGRVYQRLDVTVIKTGDLQEMLNLELRAEAPRLDSADLGEDVELSEDAIKAFDRAKQHSLRSPEPSMYPNLVTGINLMLGEGTVEEATDVLESATYNVSAKCDLEGPRVAGEIKKKTNRKEKVDVEVLVRDPGARSAGSALTDLPDDVADEVRADREADIRSTLDPQWKLNTGINAVLQTLLEADAAMLAGTHSPRIFFLTDASVWRIGVHLLKAQKNVFLIDSVFHEAPTFLTHLRRLLTWTKAAPTCDACVEDPFLCRPPAVFEGDDDALLDRAIAEVTEKFAAVERALTRPVVFEGDAFDEKALARHNLAHSALSTCFDSRDGFVVDDILDKKFVDSGHRTALKNISNMRK